MEPVQAETVIDAPRERIFGFLADLGNRATLFGDAADSFHLLRIDTRGVGAGLRFRFRTRGNGSWVDSSIVKLEAPHRISERGRGGRLNKNVVATEWELLEGPGPLCTVRVTYWTEPHSPIARALEKTSNGPRWYRRHLVAILGRLRELMESDRPEVERVGAGGGNRYATGIP